MAVKSEQLQIRVTPAEKAALKREARRAGLDVSSYVLSRVMMPGRDRVLSILASLRREPDYRFALAELNEVLVGLTPREFSEAVRDLPYQHLSPLLRNYMAAMVELAASRKGEAPPTWVADVEPMDEPHFAVPFSRLRPYLLRASPLAFRRRNIFIDATLGDRV